MTEKVQELVSTVCLSNIFKLGLYLCFRCKDKSPLFSSNENVKGHILVIFPAYNTIREVLFENIFNLHINEFITLDLLMFGNPNLDNRTNEAIFEYVHEYIK